MHRLSSRKISEIDGRRASPTGTKFGGGGKGLESESEGRKKFLPPNPLPFCPPEQLDFMIRNSDFRQKCSNFVQKTPLRPPPLRRNRGCQRTAGFAPARGLECCCGRAARQPAAQASVCRRRAARRGRCGGPDAGAERGPADRGGGCAQPSGCRPGRSLRAADGPSWYLTLAAWRRRLTLPAPGLCWSGVLRLSLIR